MKARLVARPSRAGTSLVETVISLTLFVSIVGAALFATQRGSAAYEQELTENAIQTKAGRGLNKVLRELSGSSAGSLNPSNPTLPLGTDTLNFQRPTGWADGAIQWSSVECLAFELEESEKDNGIDDDGDALVDEGVVVRIEAPGEAGEGRSVLVRGVRRYLEGELPNGKDDNGNGLLDESGLSFERVGDVLVVRLSIEGMGPQSTCVVRTVETSTQIRN